ncbi:DUF2110 family protein [Halovenus sp. HT40]|uniref:DUF2110 family protein n=1 Tax=Halovenus sp. HT40 TaxID=3126691 RepID=UPI00300ECD0B
MVVLATKCYVSGDARERSLKSLRSLLDNEVGDLDVSLDINLRDDGFPDVTLTGDDETAAANLLREEWGEIPDSFETGETYVGTLDSWDEDALVLDAGRPIRIPTDQLGLGQGDPESIRTRFGLVQHMPLTFVYDEPPRLADSQRDRLYDWQRGNGRVNVNSATRAEVRATVNRAGHAQDIVTVERIGLLEQSIICTEDTDPPGLLAGIGEYLPAELLCVVPS